MHKFFIDLYKILLDTYVYTWHGMKKLLNEEKMKKQKKKKRMVERRNTLGMGAPLHVRQVTVAGSDWNRE